MESLQQTDRYAATAATLTPCSTPEYRQFDFWAGSWEVYAPNGQMVGRMVLGDGSNRITWMLLPSGYVRQH